MGHGLELEAHVGIIDSRTDPGMEPAARGGVLKTLAVGQPGCLNSLPLALRESRDDNRDAENGENKHNDDHLDQGESRMEPGTVKLARTKGSDEHTLYCGPSDLTWQGNLIFEENKPKREA
mgnify:CR=1 FL=1